MNFFEDKYHESQFSYSLNRARIISPEGNNKASVNNTSQVSQNNYHLFDFLSVGIIICDNDGIIQYYNNYFSNKTRIVNFDVLGKDVGELIPSFKGLLKRHFRDLLNKQNANNPIITKLKDKEGSNLNIQIILNPINYERGDFESILMLILFDLDSSGNETLFAANQDDEYEKILKNKLRLEIRNISERLEIVENLSDHGFWDLDFETGETHYNKKFADIVGYKSEECSNFDLVKYESIVHPEDLIIFRDAWNSHLNSVTEWLEINHRIILKNSEIKWIYLKGKIIFSDLSSKLLRFIGRIEDITAKIPFEESALINFKIEREINEFKSRYLKSISRELRTPLSTILTSSELIELFEGQITKVQKRNLFDKIKKSVAELNNLFDEVLIENNYKSKKYELNYTPIHIVTSIKKLIEKVKSENVERSAIHLEYNDENFVMHSDEKQINLIMINLLSNAIKYTPVEKKIYVAIITSNDEVKIRVEDEGRGIPIEDQEKLFDPFYRGKNVWDIVGIGLGLSIVKSALELLRGRITISSQEKRGTVITVKIPNNRILIEEKLPEIKYVV